MPIERPRRRTPRLAVAVLAAAAVTIATTAAAAEAPEPLAARGPVPAAGPDLAIEAVEVGYLPDLDLLVFEQRVAGTAGGTVPAARGELDGAPVLGYVFPTTLAPADVGFTADDGIVALAVTSHPDFDDTPLWDEDGNRDYADDGAVFHTHWVVLGEDGRVPGGLAVREIAEEEMARVLPPTHPGMPMLMDSPGFSVVRAGSTLRVLVPAQRVRGRRDFRYDGVTAYMEVATGGARPMLGVYHVYAVASGDLSLPYEVEGR